MANRDSETDLKTTPFIRDDKPPAAASLEPLPHGMFQHYAAAKKRKMPAWAAPLLGVMVFGHIVVFLGMWAKSIWELDSLDRPKNASELVIAPPPPPPPPPPKGSVKPQEIKKVTARLVKVKDLVQPLKIDRQVKDTSTGPTEGVETGEVGGQPDGIEGSPITDTTVTVAAVCGNRVVETGEQCDDGNAKDGDGCTSTCLAELPKVASVPPQMLEGSRISGNQQIVPDDVTKTEINRSGKDRLVGTFKLCLTGDGAIQSVNQLKSTGFSAYDQKILREMRAWRYRPYMVNGKPVPVCTAVTFIYSQTH